MIGIATVAHVRENERITILFNAFEGPPRLARLYGKGRELCQPSLCGLCDIELSCVAWF
jgi:hypothetical protein